jgi:hypothetical protein
VIWHYEKLRVQSYLLHKRITQALKGRRICPRMFCRPHSRPSVAYPLPFRAKVSTVFLQGFLLHYITQASPIVAERHPCLCSERPFGALRQGFSNFRNMSCQPLSTLSTRWQNKSPQNYVRKIRNGRKNTEKAAGKWKLRAKDGKGTGKVWVWTNLSMWKDGAKVNSMTLNVESKTMNVNSMTLNVKSLPLI